MRKPLKLLVVVLVPIICALLLSLSSAYVNEMFLIHLRLVDLQIPDAPFALGLAGLALMTAAFPWGYFLGWKLARRINSELFGQKAYSGSVIKKE